MSFCFDYFQKKTLFLSFSISQILNSIQQHVVEHFGYKDINALRTALYRFPDEPAVQDVFYGKYRSSSR